MMDRPFWFAWSDDLFDQMKGLRSQINESLITKDHKNNNAMTKEELAKKLNNIQYGVFISDKLLKEAKESGLVIVFGHSDDLMEVEGAIEDEGNCYGGETFLIDKKGILPDFDDLEDEDKSEEYFNRKKTAKKIEAVRCAEGEPAWTYKTDIPHVTFNVMKDDEVYCRGIVFSIEDL